MQIKRNVILSLVDKPIFAAVHIYIVMNSFRLGSQEHEAFISAVDVSLVYDIKNCACQHFYCRISELFELYHIADADIYGRL